MKKKKNDVPLPRPNSFNDINIPDELILTNGDDRFIMCDNGDPDHRIITLSSDDDLDRLSNSERHEVHRYLKNFLCLTLIPQPFVIAKFEKPQADSPNSINDTKYILLTIEKK